MTCTLKTDRDEEIYHDQSLDLTVEAFLLSQTPAQRSVFLAKGPGFKGKERMHRVVPQGYTKHTYYTTR